MNKLICVLSISILFSCNQFCENLAEQNPSKNVTKTEYEKVSEEDYDLSNSEYSLYILNSDRKMDNTTKILNVLENEGCQWTFVLPEHSEYKESLEDVNLKFSKKKYRHLLVLENTNKSSQNHQTSNLSKVVICPFSGMKRDYSEYENPKYIRKMNNKILRKVNPALHLPPTSGVSLNYLNKHNELIKFGIVSIFTQGYKSPIYLKLGRLNDKETECEGPFIYLKCQSKNVKLIEQLNAKNGIPLKKISKRVIQESVILLGVSILSPPVGIYYFYKQLRSTNRKKRIYAKHKMLTTLLKEENK